MSGFLQLPGGAPWWVTLAIIVPATLYGLMFLAMPFSVFGIKSRLERLETRLDEIQEEIRMLAFRLPEPSTNAPALPPAPKSAYLETPTVPPAPSDTGRNLPHSGNPPRPSGDRQARFEPRIDWPR